MTRDTPTAPVTSTTDLPQIIAEAADERKGNDIVILHVAEVSYLADYFIFVTGFSKPQVRAIVQSIQAEVSEKLQRTPRRVEGLTDSTWVLLDYGDAIVHVLLPREREYYNLEAFWGHAERIPFFSTQS